MSRSKRAQKCKKGLHRKNKTAPLRLSLNQIPQSGVEGGCTVVKGVSKRVIVVHPADTHMFEQAIFIVREDYAGQAGVTEQELLRQARLAAGESGTGGIRAWLRRLKAPFYAAVGAAAAGAAWLAVQLVRL